MRAIDEVVECFSRLPGIGKKSASRLAYFLLSRDKSEAQSLANSIANLHSMIHSCPVCGSFTDRDESDCEFCSDISRDRTTICVVERPQDVHTISSLPEYRGLFHVLGGVIAPLDGVGPEQLKIRELLIRIEKENIQEVILATNPTIEGDTTALYIQKLLEDKDVKLTRLAAGLPVGGDLEYTDRLTLLRSFKGRSGF
ncbi:MAG: recombination protein RecR [Treponema sp.]|nr:MAG: recombination protein RecR [Treponema sp.]